MKKLLMAATALCLVAAPAFANEKHDGHMAETWFKKMDTNNDGYVSKEEHAAFADKMFSEADTNNDGKLTLEEVRAQKMKEKTKMHDKANKSHSNTSSNTEDKVNNNAGVPATTDDSAPNAGEK